MILTKLLVVEVFDIRQSLGQPQAALPPEASTRGCLAFLGVSINIKTGNTSRFVNTSSPRDLFAHESDLYPVLLLTTAPRALC